MQRTNGFIKLMIRFNLYLIYICGFILLHYVFVFSFGDKVLTTILHLLAAAAITAATAYLSNSFLVLSAFAFFYLGLLAFFLN